MQKNAMEWNGVEWNGMEWNGMEWNGMHMDPPEDPLYSPARARLMRPTTDGSVQSTIWALHFSTLCSVWVRPKCAPTEESTHSPLQGPLGPPLGPRIDPEGTLKGAKGHLKDAERAVKAP